MRRAHAATCLGGLATSSFGPRCFTQRGAAPKKKSTISDATAQETQKASDKGSSAKVAAEPHNRSRFWRMVREKGLPFAAYVYILGELCTLFITYLLHCDIIGAGDAVEWLKWIGLERLVDLDRQAGRHVHIFGYEVSARLGANYFIASIIAIPIFPVQLAFCSYTLPAVMAACRALKIWKRKSIQVPKAPAAGPTTASMQTKLPPSSQ